MHQSMELGRVGWLEKVAKMDATRRNLRNILVSRIPNRRLLDHLFQSTRKAYSLTPENLDLEPDVRYRHGYYSLRQSTVGKWSTRGETLVDTRNVPSVLTTRNAISLSSDRWCSGSRQTDFQLDRSGLPEDKWSAPNTPANHRQRCNWMGLDNSKCTRLES